MESTRIPVRHEMPLGMLIERNRMAGVRVERLTPRFADQRVVLHVSGGAGNRTLAAWIGAACRARVVIPDNHLSAGHPFLTGIDDLVAIYRSLIRRGTPAEQIVIVGDSVGGDLAITMLIAARELGLPMPRALVLLSPQFTARPRAELAGLPPMLIQVDQDLLGDAVTMFEALEAVGVAVELEVFTNLMHVRRPFAPMLPDAVEAIDRVGAYVDERFATRRLRITG